MSDHNRIHNRHQILDLMCTVPNNATSFVPFPLRTNTTTNKRKQKPASHQPNQQTHTHTKQNRLTSEQSSKIIKALAKLPKDFELIVHPMLLTVITDNATARQVIGRDFDVSVSALDGSGFFLRFFRNGSILIDPITIRSCWKSIANRRWPKTRTSCRCCWLAGNKS